MCTLSMVMQHYEDSWSERLRRMAEEQSRQQWQPALPPPQPVTQQEIEEFRILLDRARKYDREHGQPDCELQEKRDKLKALAKEMGVEIAFV